MMWTDTFMASWGFANNLFGRMFLLGFTAVTFAGEYQWGTWKNIIPRQRRSLLIMAKFINLGAAHSRRLWLDVRDIRLWLWRAFSDC